MSDATFSIDDTEVFGTTVNVVSQDEAVGWIIAEALTVGSDGCSAVVTPNMDHCVRLRTDARFRRAYRTAFLRVADGMPLVWASRLTGRALPERVTGADLVEPLCAAAAEAELRVFLLGPSEAVNRAAAARLTERHPGLQIAGTFAPSYGFIDDMAERARMVEAVNASGCNLLFVALGSPRQEIFVAEHQHELRCGVALGVGAALDFLAGTQQRAPKWTRRLGLEGVYRALSNPRRLFVRYARCAYWLPLLMAGQAGVSLRGAARAAA
ncbi:WecB/TagA/CpsF family glycosyltransferase [Marinivivus vitaminiproducens]|uniref:WecB/TagA/CpsF family glycosyltransferase n=1 Tax=Marinivivus vitaminiproducens TaxID=3035935 RepID=UPI0027AB7BDD|nr:WecB/TagA/CpsF family glycosyltransferase [Geminicoccaceae bacterium SCSIO 64248]